MRAINSTQLAERVIDRARDEIAHPELYRGWSTGILDLDKMIGGILRRRYYVVGGKQKGGKSAFLVSMCIHLNKQNVKVLYISIEMDNDEIGIRVFSNLSGVEQTKFRDATLNRGDLISLESWQKTVAAFPGFWDFGATSLESLQTAIDEVCPDVVIVDYFQLMEFEGRTREGLSQLSKGLKKLTNRKRNACTVIVASQLNRASIRGGEYDANAFLETSALEQDADVAMLIIEALDEEGDTIENQRKIKVVASRVSGIGEVPVFFNGARSLVAGVLPTGTDVRQLWYNDGG